MAVSAVLAVLAVLGVLGVLGVLAISVSLLPFVVVQGVQPQHVVFLALLLEEGQVLLAPLEHIAPSLPRVGRHLDLEVTLTLAGGTVAPFVPLAREAGQVTTVGLRPGM